MGEALQQRHGVPVEYQDERLTSFAAEADLVERKLNRRAKRMLLMRTLPPKFSAIGWPSNPDQVEDASAKAEAST